MTSILDFLTITDYIKYLHDSYIEGAVSTGAAVILCMLIFIIISLISFIMDEDALGIKSEELPMTACITNIFVFILLLIIIWVNYNDYNNRMAIKDFTTDFQKVRIVSEENGERINYTGELRESTCYALGIDLYKKVKVYSDKDGYIVAVKYNGEIHFNKKVLNLNNKDVEPDNIEKLSNGSIEIIEE